MAKHKGPSTGGVALALILTVLFAVAAELVMLTQVPRGPGQPPYLKIEVDWKKLQGK